MPDLRTESAVGWLDAMRPPQIASAWPPSHRSLENSAEATGLLVEFGALLDQETDRAPGEIADFLQDPDNIADLQQIFAQIGAARPLSFFHWLRQTGLPGHLQIERALLEGETAPARALFATITTIARQATLRRLISTDRMEELLTATDIANKEPSHV